MIPLEITAEDILKAIRKIDSDDYSPDRKSDDYDLYYEGRFYPPKVVISYANIFAKGEEWPSDKFSGGEESNNFLIHRGFPILTKTARSADYPFTKEEITFFDKYANQPYNSKDPIHKNAGVFINKYIWGRSRYWADQIHEVSPYIRKGSIHWNEKRNNKTGQAFKYYSWYQLHHADHYHDKVFFTVGIEGPRSPDYLKSHLVIKLDCRRSGIDKNLESRFDKLLLENRIGWKFIHIQADDTGDWQYIINDSLTYLKETLPIYLEAIRLFDNRSLEMAARIVWNDNNWISPSGRSGKSRSHAKSQEKEYGFTPEEWLLDLDKTIDGFHYACMEALNTKDHVGKSYNLTLFASNWDIRQWYWVGKITGAEVITDNQSELITKEYLRRGWLNEQIWQLGELENVNVQRYIDWHNYKRFNVRFRPEDFRSYELAPFSENEVPPSGHYNLPTLKKLPGFLTRQEAEGEVDDLVFGSENEEGPKKKIKREHRPQVRELENVHRHVQTGYANYLRRHKSDGHKIYTESYKRKSKVRVDILEVTPTNEKIFFEVKTYPSSRYSIRAALGQLFEYAYFPLQKLADEFVIVSHLPASADELAYLQHLGKELGIKVRYVCFDWKKGVVVET
jgi:hypothetical protein